MSYSSLEATVEATTTGVPALTTTPLPPTIVNGVLPNGGLMTPHDQRRRAALLADSPELSSRPPLNAGGSVLGVIHHLSSAGSSSSTTSSSHNNQYYGFDKVEVCLDDVIEVDQPRRCCWCCKCCPQRCGTCCSGGTRLKNTLSGLTDSYVWKSIMLGQLISLLVCTITVLCQILVENYTVKVPAGQSLAKYLLMSVIYLSMYCCRRHSQPLCTVFKRRGIRYFFLAVVDVEANYLIQRAFQYTTLTSVQLLDCFSIPTVLILSWSILRTRYRLTHIGGMALGLMSVVALVWADIDDGKGGVSAGGIKQRNSLSKSSHCIL